MSLLTHLLACLFGMGSWVSINGLWVELPLVVPQIPEGWRPERGRRHLRDRGPGDRGQFLLGFFWKETAVVAGSPRSVALLALTFFLAAVDCTSSVTFLPFMMRLQPQYLTTYYIGEGRHDAGVSGGLPAAELHPAVAREDPNGRYTNGVKEKSQRNTKWREQKPMMDPYRPSKPKRRSSFGSGVYSWTQVIFIFVVLAWVNALTNVVLPSVQSYSCMPYGNNAYHLSATMAAVSNPLACFIAMFLPIRSLLLMGALTVIGSGVGAYIMSMAVLSPCPLLVNDTSGAVVMVLAWIVFVLTLSYVKVIIGVILRDEGHSALVWCGAVVQFGSLLGAVTMFPLVSLYSYFSSGDPCNTRCP
ncbi:hypothetical protein INR49_009309 [Caranx melampygus]|nr:hypothetical protein INR49_009309 [Caranx melampygus]